MNSSQQYISYWKRLKIAFQYVMPQLYLTRFAGWLATEMGNSDALHHWLFAKKYNINMAEAEKKEFSDYASFNEFFIRSLAADLEILIKNFTALCLPADGKISRLKKLMISYYCKLKDTTLS